MNLSLKKGVVCLIGESDALAFVVAPFAKRTPSGSNKERGSLAFSSNSIAIEQNGFSGMFTVAAWLP